MTWLVCSALMTFAAVEAHAQIVSDPVAIELKQKGDAAIEAGLYQEALDAYTRALEVEPTAALHYNRGRALQGLGRNAEALAEFEDFDATATPDLKSAVPRLPEMMATVRARTAELAVACSTQGAQLRLDGKLLAFPLPKPLRLDPGDYSLEVEAPGHVPWKETLSLRAGERRALAPELQVRDERAVLEVVSPVAGATVLVDGKQIGTVPVQVRLTSGEHELLVSHPDFSQARSRVVLGAGEHRQLAVDLDPLPRFYERWWFWTAVGVLAAGGVALGIALNTERDASAGDIPPGRISAPILAR